MAEKTEVGKRAALFEQEVLDSLADVDGAFTVVLPGFGGQRILALGEQLSRYYDALAQAGRTAVRALVVSDERQAP